VQVDHQYAAPAWPYRGHVRIDLHTHTRHSDGTDTPAELVRAAVAAGVDVVAVTDHDVTSGWAEAGRTAEEIGLSVVPGIEVSCSRRGVSVHLLGYFVDPGHPGLTTELALARDNRVSRLERMTRRLAADGYPVTFSDVLSQADDGATLGRPHLADALVAAGVFADRAEAFTRVLHRSSRYYVSHYAPDPVRAVQLVLAAGGVPVMAHPFAAARGVVVGDDVIREMAGAGLAGLEVDHRDHTDGAREHAAALGRRLGLLHTGASDYHGSGKPNRLGENLTTQDALAAIVERGTGSPLLGRPLP
jgi:3',5'-nucleoside bisphosphate phosphatase